MKSDSRDYRVWIFNFLLFDSSLHFYFFYQIWASHILLRSSASTHLSLLPLLAPFCTANILLPPRSVATNLKVQREWWWLIIVSPSRTCAYCLSPADALFAFLCVVSVFISPVTSQFFVFIGRYLSLHLYHKQARICFFLTKIGNWAAL